VNDKLKFVIFGLIAGGFIVWAFMSSSISSKNTRMTGDQINNITGSSAIDAHFIEQMIPHHEDAITMANIALEKATHPEIKTLAKDIVKAQSDEIIKMKGWYKDWFGTDVPDSSPVMGMHGMGQDGMHMGMMGNQTDITILEQAPHFDKVFIEEMIPHHQMAVMMAGMLKSTTSRDEMKKLADNIISAQTKEINEMREWYKTWGY